MSKQIENVKITGTTLGIEDHGILTAFLYVEGAGWGCSFGGYSFGHPKKPAVYGMHFIAEVLKVVGVDKWESLKGAHIRVEMEGGWGGSILRIGHLIEDRWFDPKELADKLRSAGT